MNAKDLLTAKTRVGYNNKDLAGALGIKKSQVDKWVEHNKVPDSYVNAVKRACGIAIIKQKTHPAVRTSSGVRFGWEER